ncbi:hypothetical protein EBR57_01180 [bacterium]|nr:hypothetical protein [bacterium]
MSLKISYKRISLCEQIGQPFALIQEWMTGKTGTLSSSSKHSIRKVVPVTIHVQQAKQHTDIEAYRYDHHAGTSTKSTKPHANIIDEYHVLVEKEPNNSAMVALQHITIGAKKGFKTGKHLVVDGYATNFL